MPSNENDIGEKFDALIADLNTSLRYLFEGQCIAYCDAIQKIAVKIAALKNGLLNELAAKNETIDRLRADQREA
jgi:hypothetical protein